MVNRGRSNNFGFINDQDYDSTAHSPLLAIIGDSFIEAQMVPFAETMQGRLARCVGGRGRVYSFGSSGAPLSEYLGEADYARSKFRPDAVLVLVVGNDFDRSLRRYNGSAGFHLFRQDSTGLVLTLTTYRPTLSRRIIRHSALARYVVSNLAGGVTKLGSLLEGGSNERTRYVGNTEATVGPERMRDSRAAVDEFLKELPSRTGLPANRIIVMVDARRPDMYTPEGLARAQGSYFDIMRRYLLEHARAGGFDVIDMQERFMRRHAMDGSRFEFPTDEHWNGTGHEVAAASAAASRVFQTLFPGACPQLAQEVRRVAQP
jgi:hypothetical protein